MSEQGGYYGGAPTPEQNRADYAAAHPDAAPVDQGQAQEQVAQQLGAAAPGPGVSSDQLGEQMAAAGAHAGLPYEDQMNALMEQVRAQQAQIQQLITRDQQREQAAVAALGVPLLQRYANGLRDKLTAHAAANPGGADHFAPAIEAAAKLADSTASAISRGANDLGTVRYYVGQLERFFSRGHAKAPGHVKHVDVSAAADDLDAVAAEADRLSDGAPPATVTGQPALTAS